MTEVEMGAFVVGLVTYDRKHLLAKAEEIEDRFRVMVTTQGQELALLS